MDIQTKWVGPCEYKNLDSLADVAGLIIDDYYVCKKNGFDRKLHQGWADRVCMDRIQYAYRDTYACYDIWMHITLIWEGLIEANERKVMKAIQASIKKKEEEKRKLKEEAERLKKFR